MLKFVIAPLLVLAAGVVLLMTLFHVIFSLPFWLVAGGIAALLWYRSGNRRLRLEGSSRRGYLARRSRW